MAAASPDSQIAATWEERSPEARQAAALKIMVARKLTPREYREHEREVAHAAYRAAATPARKLRALEAFVRCFAGDMVHSDERSVGEVFGGAALLNAIGEDGDREKDKVWKFWGMPEERDVRDDDDDTPWR